MKHERKQEDRRVSHGYRPLYRDACIPDRQFQAGYLEQLRYKWGRYSTATRFMREIGTFGRKYWYWLAVLQLLWLKRLL